jgi:hypothetical protein
MGENKTCLKVWKQVCADLFQGLDSMHANGMIRGWEALWLDSGNRPTRPVTNIAPDLATPFEAGIAIVNS